MMLSGNLSDWSVGDLLQMLHITKKTASLHVDGVDRSGVVHFDGGMIVNAEVSLGGGPSGDPKDEVVEAVYVLELLDEGSFEIRNEVPPRMIEPLAVSEALELAGQHLDAERHLGETGLLAARGLRLAQAIEEPILLSEQVWNAISVSIPAFTFPELEQRLGRAGAVSTVEQFRDLGILEAVLDETDVPAPGIESAPLASPIEPSNFDPNDFQGFAEATDEELDSQLADAFAGSWTPPASESDYEEMLDPAVPDRDMFDQDAEVFGHDGEDIVPQNAEDVRPIMSDAPDDSIVVDDDHQAEPAPAPVSPGLSPGASSLSAAIRAAAGAAAVAPSDDEAQLLSEAAGERPAEPTMPADSSDDDGSLRRTVKSLVSPAQPAQNGGVLGDLGSRFRQVAAGEQDD